MSISLFLISQSSSPRREFKLLPLVTPFSPPTKLVCSIDETQPRKRIFLRYRLPSDNDYTNLVPIFKYFLRIPDQLAKSAHFRPEVLKKVRSVRDTAIKRIQKADEEAKAEERAIEKEKERKAKRDAELNALDAKGQKKYLEREKEKMMKKGVKKQTARA